MAIQCIQQPQFFTILLQVLQRLSMAQHIQAIEQLSTVMDRLCMYNDFSNAMKVHGQEILVWLQVHGEDGD